MRTAIVQAGGLKLHLTPNGTVDDVLNHGDVVEVTDEERQTGTVKWVYVQVRRTQQWGWVAARFLADMDTAAAPPAQSPIAPPYRDAMPSPRLEPVPHWHLPWGTIIAFVAVAVVALVLYRLFF